MYFPELITKIVNQHKPQILRVTHDLQKPSDEDQAKAYRNRHHQKTPQKQNNKKSAHHQGRQQGKAGEQHSQPRDQSKGPNQNIHHQSPVQTCFR